MRQKRTTGSHFLIVMIVSFFLATPDTAFAVRTIKGDGKEVEIYFLKESAEICSTSRPNSCIRRTDPAWGYGDAYEIMDSKFIAKQRACSGQKQIMFDKWQVKCSDLVPVKEFGLVKGGWPIQTIYFNAHSYGNFVLVRISFTPDGKFKYVEDVYSWGSEDPFLVRKETVGVTRFSQELNVVYLEADWTFYGEMPTVFRIEGSSIAGFKNPKYQKDKWIGGDEFIEILQDGVQYVFVERNQKDLGKILFEKPEALSAPNNSLQGRRP